MCYCMRKKPTLKRGQGGSPGRAKYELDKFYVKAKTCYVDTRERMAKVQLAKERVTYSSTDSRVGR